LEGWWRCSSSVVDDGAGGDGSFAVEGDWTIAKLWGRYVPVVVSRHEQEWYAAMVRYEGLREQNEGEAISGAAGG
jgi:hypothetical protein